MKKYLGIDQGGSKTAAIVCDEAGNILGVGKAQGYDYGDRTSPHNDNNIRIAAKEACNIAGYKLQDISAVCAGLTEIDWEYEAPLRKERVIKTLGIQDVTTVNDCIIAMHGGPAQPECAVICAGTGLNIAIKRRDGKQITYGYYVTDELQGASALGAAAIQKITKAHAGTCEETMLTRLILEYTGHASVEELLIDMTTKGYHLERRLLAPFVTNAYKKGDQMAAQIIDEFAKGVAKYIVAGMRSLNISGNPLPIVFSGGVFTDTGESITDQIIAHIRENEPNVQQIHAKYQPVCGAVLYLLKDNANENFYNSAKALGLLRTKT